MGGSNEVRLPGPANLRIHESGGEVHIHDDKTKEKFVMDKDDFKIEYPDVRDNLKLCVRNSIYKGELFGSNATKLIGEVNGGSVEWSLEAPAVVGFSELDTFVGTL